jgi:protein-disulfide isomerase
MVCSRAAIGGSVADIENVLRQLGTRPDPLSAGHVDFSLDGDPSAGPTDAKVTIVEFADFQCPYCALASAELRRVRAQFPDTVRVVFKQYPLDGHSQSDLASRASLAAAAQGKFWEMHDVLFGNYREISRDRVLSWAAGMGLDMRRFRRDLKGSKSAAIIRAEHREADSAGVEGTPTFFINGSKLEEQFTAAAVSPLIARKLGRQ